MKIFRCNISPYQSKDFSGREKNALEKLAGINYLQDTQKAQVLITNTNTKTIDLNTKEVELIIHPNSGYDNFSVDFVKNAPFPIVIGSEIRSSAVSEYILNCLLNRFSSIPKQASWDRSWQNRNLLKDQNVLIVGLGKIGKKIRDTVTPLVKNVYALDPYIENAANSLEDIPLKDCSVIILCAGLNATSEKIINAKILSQCPPDLTLINAARGKLVDQEHLLNFLNNNSESYAYLDVFEKEPISFKSLNSLPNLSMTSHIAGVFDRLDTEIINFEIKVIKDFMEDRCNFEKKYHNCILKNRIHDNILV